MNLQQEIANWDEKLVEDLEAIYERHSTETGLGAELVPLLKDPSVQQGASWILKRHLEQGCVLKAAELRSFFQTLPVLEDWQTKLHLLQSLPFLTIEKQRLKYLEPFLRACLDEKNKFVRAWAYNGFYELALQHPKYQTEVDQLLEQAMQDEAASVKARVRNIRKDLR